jgi:hypothetical protein
MTLGRFMIISLATIALTSQPVFAGEFYKLYPRWLELGYHLSLTLLILGSMVVSFLIFSNFKGGKLGWPWILVMIGFGALLVRMVMSLLTVFDAQFFQAVAFAGLDILFFILILIGLILYKIGIE